jgi:tRNA-splicing ligase RtcB
MPIAEELTGGRVPVKVWARSLEATARRQLENVARLPIVHGHVAAMPDVHAGIGATVGSVIPTKGAIIPAAVGVDLGCGMNAVKLSIGAEDLPESLGRIRSAIEAAVPVGFDAHGPRTEGARKAAAKTLEPRLARIVERTPKLRAMQRDFDATWVRQLASLGGGNHFIEVCLDESQRVWVMLHSGSRGIGNAIGRHFIERARREMEKRDTQLPDRDLAWLEEGSASFDAYVEAVEWAQDYAATNRREMVRLVLGAMAAHLPPFEAEDEAISCHHNYVARERHFGRRPLRHAQGRDPRGRGRDGHHPGSMGRKSYIVRGRGNPESLCSCAHGAGRRMSRAKRSAASRTRISRSRRAASNAARTATWSTRFPAAYKPIDEVMEDQSDLVEVVHTLKQVVCVKG